MTERFKRTRYSPRRGAALIVVLACIVIIACMLAAFLGAVRTDFSASNGYAAQVTTRTLAESALNVAIGQISKATASAQLAWSSQPGLIRTYDSGGAPVQTFKLYTCDTMEVSGPFTPEEDLPPVDWAANSDLYADLNKPLRSGSSVIYPIIDASGLAPSARNTLIFDSNGDGNPDVEGFEVLDPKVAKVQSDSPNELPMPVKWMYQLRNGNYAIATPHPSGGVQLTDITGASIAADNPPVARFAFWTDDESSKVNINTASEGTPWDTPFCNTFYSAGARPAVSPSSPAPPPVDPGSHFYEADFEKSQPAQHEYQRYPGHPATTCLSTVLGSVLRERLFGSDLKILNTSQRQQLIQSISDLAPRISDLQTATSDSTNSSMGGTQEIIFKGYTAENLKIDADRLYSSVDELLFADGATVPRTENKLSKNPEEDRKLLEKLRFFLTAQSRAPEVNVWNKPRVVCWPISSVESPSYRTAFDRLLAFCGTVRQSATQKSAFYFTRGPSGALSPTSDLLPNSRNLELYDYLLGLLGSPIPGFTTSSLNAKYQQDTEQVLTEIFDYIRCLNLQDVSGGGSFQPYTGKSDTLRGQVIPIKHPSNGSRGFGRFPTVSSVVVSMVATNTPSTAQTELELAIVPELFDPMCGYSATGPNMEVIFSQLSDLRINDAPVPFTANCPGDTKVMTSNGLNPGVPCGSRAGGYLGVSPLLRSSDKAPISDRILVPGNNQKGGQGYPNATLKIGGRIHFKIYGPRSGMPASPSLVQTFELEFPDTTVLVPRLGSAKRSIQSRLTSAIGTRPQEFVMKEDTVLSLVATGGVRNGNLKEAYCDFRLVAANEAPGDYFALHSNAGKRAIAHSLRAAWGVFYIDGTFGSLVSGFTDYNTPAHKRNASTGDGTDYGCAPPGIPPSIKDVMNYKGAAGDWDNGPGLYMDGALINKADEGTRKNNNNLQYLGDSFSLQETGSLYPTMFSPNRQMPSPVMFGSLPTGVKRVQPWQTLLFRPDRLYFPGGYTVSGRAPVHHPGAADGSTPPDHLWLDLFWMPIVEPYAVSEPFSTAGKVNLNQQIAPFTYIRRDTALRAVLKGTQIVAMDPNRASPDDASRKFINRYKFGGQYGGSPGYSGFPNGYIRYPIDPDASLARLHARLAGKLDTGSDPDKAVNGKPFLSSSEVCDIPLVPEGIVAAGATVGEVENALARFWNFHGGAGPTANNLTGDNALERPYAHIYPRITTKSNTFNVHVLVQSLLSRKGAEAATFNSRRDPVLSEYRGSYIIERYLDPNTQNFDVNDRNSILGPYKIRVLSTKQLSL